MYNNRDIKKYYGLVIMKYIDLHCDSLNIAFQSEHTDVYENCGLSVDIVKLKKSNALAQIFAIYMPPCDELVQRGITDDEYIKALYNILTNTIDTHREEVALVRHYADLVENEQKERVSVMLSLEDGRAVNGNFRTLYRFYEMGIRMINPTWNTANCWGFPNSEDETIMQKGLTVFGKNAVEYCNNKGILIDVSHLSDGGFWDVVTISKKPIAASHSNCRALVPHPRNLTDEMIRAIAEKGGVVGSTFVPTFLSVNQPPRYSKLEDISRHIQHTYQIGGEDVLAIGTDFDGTTGYFDIANSGEMQMLYGYLAGGGMPARILDKMFYKNALRIFKDTI